MSRRRTRRDRKLLREGKPIPAAVARGLWRDGNYLVIDEKSHRFAAVGGLMFQLGVLMLMGGIAFRLNVNENASSGSRTRERGKSGYQYSRGISPIGDA